MKIEVTANSFCPDDCRFCKPHKMLIGENRYMTVCENQMICRNIYDLFLSQNNKEETKRGK